MLAKILLSCNDSYIRVRFKYKDIMICQYRMKSRVLTLRHYQYQLALPHLTASAWYFHYIVICSPLPCMLCGWYVEVNKLSNNNAFFKQSPFVCRQFPSVYRNITRHSWQSHRAITLITNTVKSNLEKALENNYPALILWLVSTTNTTNTWNPIL